MGSTTKLLGLLGGVALMALVGPSEVLAQQGQQGGQQGQQGQGQQGQGGGRGRPGAGRPRPGRHAGPPPQGQQGQQGRQGRPGRAQGRRPGRRPVQRPVARIFRALDKNGDDKIDASEAAQAGARLQKLDIMKADADGDGFVTRDELRAYLRGLARQRAAGAQSLRDAIKKFRAADSDKNRRLDAAEWSAAQATAAFADVDADGDGKVTPREVNAYIRSHHGTSPF